MDEAAILLSFEMDEKERFEQRLWNFVFCGQWNSLIPFYA